MKRVLGTVVGAAFQKRRVLDAVLGKRVGDFRGGCVTVVVRSDGLKK